MSDLRPHPTSVAVVHRVVPGPSSSDPRDRQVFRRLLQLADLGLEVTLVPVEPHLEGGAPRTLDAAGVDIAIGPRETAAHRISRVTRGPGLVVLCTLAVPEAILDAVVSSERTVVLDLDHLPSAQRDAARPGFRSTEADGLATEISHLHERERRLIDRADLVICNSEHTAGGVRALIGPERSTTVTVIAPTAPRRTATPTLAPGAAVVVPGRFSDEFGTPDESALRTLLDAVELCRPPTGSSPTKWLLTPEDTAPRLRHGVKGRIEVLSLRRSTAATRAAVVAFDVRPYGLPTTARRAELIAAGVPVVVSSHALGAEPPVGPMAGLTSDDPLEQLEIAERLRRDHGVRASTVADILELAAVHATSLTTDLLAGALGSLGIDVRPGTGVATPMLVVPDEYRSAPTDGTLAAADARIEQLEREMIPVRLHSRDDSINLQSTMDADQRYRVFAKTHLEAAPANEPHMSAATAAISFSILVPTYSTDPDLLVECLDSVREQRHTNWELCIVDDGSPTTEHLEVLRRAAAEDPRIRIQLNPYNQGIALATNDALAMATGDWVVLLDHDDVLKPDALAWVAAYADRCPDYDLWYSDEDKISLDGQLVMPFFKPDWSPDLLMGVNYVCHLLSVRRGLIESVGGFRAGFDGAQDYDLVLRMVEQAERVGHIAKPLYSWRMIPGSTALDTGAKPKAHHAGHEALRDALGRRFEPGTVEDGEFDTTHVVRYAVDTEQLLTIMIPTRDRVDLLRDCVERLERATGGVRYELLVVDNQSTDPATLEYLDRLVAEGHQVVRYPHEFSFARQINLGALHARGDLLLILNNDALARNDDWLLRMMEHAQRPDVGLVGARLMFPENQRGGRPQHEGIVMGMAGLAYNIDLGGYMGMDQFVRDCSSVTAACVMLRPSVFFAVGGMDERLRVAYNDVDFGLRISELGYRVVYTPHAVLEHPESASRGSLHPQEDEDWLIQRWGLKGAVREPFVSPQFEWLMPVFYRL